MAKIEKLSKSRVKIEIDVSKEQFEHGLDHAFDKVKEDVEIKGFRKGKVTRKIYEQHKGVESLYEEALNHIIQDTYYDAIEAHNLEVVAQPKIDLDITKIERGKDFSYTATVAVKPEVKLGTYKGFEYEKESVDVSDEEIDKAMESLLNQNAELIIKEDGVLEKNDTAVFDFEGFVDGEAFEGGKAENHELQIGSGQFIPGFEDQMIGMKPGEERDVNVKFPDDYQAENLKGKDAVFKTKLHEIKFKQVPELNDAFVKDLDREGIDTVVGLKDAEKLKLVQQKEQTSQNKAIDFAVDQAAQNAEIEIPQEMIENEKNRMLDNTKRQAQQYGLDFETYLQFSGMNQEQFEAQLLKDAERSIRYNLTIEAIAKEENVEATDEEVESKFEELSKQYNMDVEQIKTQVNPDAVRQEVIFRKTIDWLVDTLKTK